MSRLGLALFTLVHSKSQSLDPNSRPPTEIVERNETVKLNSLAVLLGHVLTYEKKIREHFPKVSYESAEILSELNGTVDELVYHYKMPKKFSGKKEDEAE